jgi:hypothetical protein
MGPLPVVQIPSFGIDPNLLLTGLAVLGVIMLFSRGSRTVRRYARKQRARSERRKQLREELRNL